MQNKINSAEEKYPYSVRRETAIEQSSLSFGSPSEYKNVHSFVKYQQGSDWHLVGAITKICLLVHDLFTS